MKDNKIGYDVNKNEIRDLSKMTKDEITKVIAEKEQDTKTNHEELETLHKYARTIEIAEDLKNMHDIFVNRGFTGEEAAILLSTVVTEHMKKFW